MEIAEKIAIDLKVSVSQIEAAIRLLDAGDTIPFIARYRKEATQGLTDTQLRYLDDKLYQLRELEERRQTILETLRGQNQLTPELEQVILAAQSKARLEDLYLPYRPRKKSKAQAAKEAGLAPLAESIFRHAEKSPEEEAAPVATQLGMSLKDALDGAQQILVERLSEDADVLQRLRKHVWEHGILVSQVRESKKNETQKYKDYFEYQEPIHKIPSHRALALLRGRREEVLSLKLKLDDSVGLQTVMHHFGIENRNRPADSWLSETAAVSWKTRIRSKLELEAFSRLKEVAEEEGIKVFSKNLRALLMASPAGEKVIMGLDPGIRTGVKLVVIDQTGKVLDYSVIYPFGADNAKEAAITELAKLAMKYPVELISIGNGTASRETAQLVGEVVKRYPDLTFARVIVNEAGASVYSASELAAEEFPELDVTLRGAVSIARRLQDPLAELVKIDPKAIGVGQYQHDVNQTRLARCLDGVVQDCVNEVGVDLNTASVSLLSKVSGLNESIANQIVSYRNENGRFLNREQLKLVPRLGTKTFEQAAGFLRIKQGDNPLDASAVHPEMYPLVESIFREQNWKLEEVMGHSTLLKTVNLATYVNEQHGLPTLRDMMSELEKPGRDPRPEFQVVQFTPGIEHIADLKLGMILTGVVNNITNFGAFVDIGVHQEGLVHISELANRFVSDPHAVLKPGAKVTVKVIELELDRRRIGLSMKALEEAPSRPPHHDESAETAQKEEPRKRGTTGLPRHARNDEGTSSREQPRDHRKAKSSLRTVKESVPQKAKAPMNTAMADALLKWKEKQHD